MYNSGKSGVAIKKKQRQEATWLMAQLKEHVSAV